jgi:AraC-like DNA-binding protein
MALALTDRPGRLMPAFSNRDRRLRARRATRDDAGQHPTIAELAREFAISRSLVYQVLYRTGGDPAAFTADLETSSIEELEREHERLRDRIAADRRRLRQVMAYLDSKRISLINGTDEFGLAG